MDLPSRYFYEINPEASRAILADNNGFPLLELSSPAEGTPGQADIGDLVRRITSCLNACGGITDNELSHGSVEPRHRMSKVVDQRERLKQALRDAYLHIALLGSGQIPPRSNAEACDAAASAISQAEDSDFEPDDKCEECARSFGPHYVGACEHEDAV